MFYNDKIMTQNRIKMIVGMSKFYRLDNPYYKIDRRKKRVTFISENGKQAYTFNYNTTETEPPTKEIGKIVGGSSIEVLGELPWEHDFFLITEVFNLKRGTHSGIRKHEV